MTTQLNVSTASSAFPGLNNPCVNASDLRVQNAAIFTVVKNAQRLGNSCLPFYLGLDKRSYQQFLNFLSIFDSREEVVLDQIKAPKEDLRQELLDIRQDECNDLYNLLVSHRSNLDDSEIMMASMVVAGCLGSDHLWKDLGLPNRAMLGQLLEGNFPTLFHRNQKDMKWKKFFYKQLCEQEGSYVCRAPTCEQCKAYDDCFGPEE